MSRIGRSKSVPEACDRVTHRTLSVRVLEADASSDLKVISGYLDIANELQMNEDHAQALTLVKAALMVTVHFSVYRTILLKVFSDELSVLIDTTTAFRENNLTLLLLRGIFSIAGGPSAVRYLLASPLKPLLVEAESTPEKDGEAVALAVESIISRCTKRLLSASGTASKSKKPSKKEACKQLTLLFGPALGVLSYAIQKSLGEERPDLVTSLFFLRFICPALTAPKEHGLTKRTPSPAAMSRLCKAAKLLQAVANRAPDTSIGGLPGTFVEGFVKKQHKCAEKFILEFMSGPLQLQPFPVVDLAGAVKQLDAVGFDGATKLTSMNWSQDLRFIGHSTDYVTAVRKHQVRSYGFALTPLEPHSMIPALFGTLWAAQYEIALVPGSVQPLTKEVVQAAVSVINNCQLCVSLHSGAAVGHGMSPAVLHDLIHGKELSSGAASQEIMDAVEWARVSNAKGHYLVRNPPFDPDKATEIYAAAFLKHYFNRITNTFLKEYTKTKGNVLKSKVFQRKQKTMEQANRITKRYGHGLAFSPALGAQTQFPCAEELFHVEAQRGSVPVNEVEQLDETDVSFNTEGTLPTVSGEYTGDLDHAFRWAVTKPAIAEALMRWKAFEEALITECVPLCVVEKFHEVIDSWDGTVKYTESQLMDCVVGMPKSEGLLAMLMIRVAQDPSRVSSRLTNRCSELYPPNVASASLVGACSYAAFAASMRVASFWGYTSDSPHSSFDEHTAHDQDSDPFTLNLPCSIVQCDGREPPFEVVVTDTALILRIGTIDQNTKARIEGPFQNKRKLSFKVKLEYPKKSTLAMFSSMPHGSVTFSVEVPPECGTISMSDIVAEKNVGILELTFPHKQIEVCSMDL